MGLKNVINNLFGSKEENDCMKVLDMLDRILDEEANPAERQKFTDHIEKCMPCYEKYNLDKSMKELLRVRCNHSKVPAGLVDSIRLQISQSGRA